MHVKIKPNELRDYSYMLVAFSVALQSKSYRKKIGAILVANTNGIPHIIAEGTNGTPPGSTLSVEDEYGVTRPEVVHAEINAILKCKELGLSLKDTTLYVTTMPCPCCCKTILEEGIKRVVYSGIYKNPLGIEMLENNGVEVCQINYHNVYNLSGSMLNRTNIDFSGALRDIGYCDNFINQEIVKKMNRGL